MKTKLMIVLCIFTLGMGNLTVCRAADNSVESVADVALVRPGCFVATLLGSAIWCSVLCWLGVKMGQDDQLMKGEYHRITLWLGGAMLVLGGLYYFFVHRHMANSPKSKVQSPKSE